MNGILLHEVKKAAALATASRQLLNHFVQQKVCTLVHTLRHNICTCLVSAFFERVLSVINRCNILHLTPKSVIKCLKTGIIHGFFGKAGHCKMFIRRSRSLYGSLDWCYQQSGCLLTYPPKRAHRFRQAVPPPAHGRGISAPPVLS